MFCRFYESKMEKCDDGNGSGLGYNQPFRAYVQTECVKTKVLKNDCNSVSVLPLCWDSIFTIYNELVKLIDRIPFQKHLVVTVVFRGAKFRIDLGEVRAAGVVCLIGLGLSLGTLLLYKLYLRIIIPFLQTIRAAKGEDSWLDDDYTLYLENSESEVDKMGNSNSKRPPLPNVYYSPGSGVTVGSRPPSPCHSNEGEESYSQVGVRLRPKASARHKSPSPSSDKDSAIGAGGSEMSQSLYSENSMNRDSFYSTCTAESGFDDLGFLEELRSSKLSGSLKENFSPNSLKERNLQMLYRAHRGRDPGLNTIGKGGLDTLSDCSSDHSGIISSCSTRSSHCSSTGTFVRTNVDPLEHKISGNNCERHHKQRHLSSDKPGIAFSTPSSERNDSALKNSCDGYQSSYSSNKSSPYRPTPVRTCDKLNNSRRHLQDGETRQHSINKPHLHNDSYMEEDLSLDASESIHSFNSSVGDINWEDRQEEEKEMESSDQVSLPPHLNQSLSDLQFRQSLMQRIQEWSSFAEEYNKSRSPTPDCSPIRFVRRSRSLDRHLSDSSIIATESEIPSSKPIEIEPVTEKNLETLEYELHDIQGEFESITSKLHDLIEQGTTVPLSQTPMSSSYPAAFTKNSTSSRRTMPLCSDLSSQLQVPSTPLNTGDSRHAAVRKMKTKWERVPGSACSDSSRSSRASSVEYVWDLADYSPNNTADRSKVEDNRSIGSHSRTRLLSTDLCPVDAADCVVNIGSPVSVLEYCEQEWKGDTARAQAIREGYQKIPTQLQCERMCVIRGDNYCALRSTLFQVLVNGIRLTHTSWGIIGIMDRLHDYFEDPTIQMSSWTFANRLPGHCKDKLASISKCALSLYATVEEVSNLPTREEREKRTINLFNTSSTFDLELMEGLKVMMLLQLVALRQKTLDGEDIPIFGHLLFARDTSESVSDFIKNHLNCVGDSGGLEQVEMCLLGYTLGISIRVLRLSHSGQEDFECCFPDDMPSDSPQVVLIAEDDRHYNVPLP